LRKDKWARLDDAISREGWKIIFLSQVHPFFPTSLLNYFYGITRIRFRTCIVWIALAQFPGIFFYSYLGTLAQLGLKLFGRKTPPHPYEYVIWFGGLLLTAVVTAGIGRIALRMLGQAGATVTDAVNSESEKAAYSGIGTIPPIPLKPPPPARATRAEAARTQR
jgi:hypothetical protein